MVDKSHADFGDFECRRANIDDSGKARAERVELGCGFPIEIGSRRDEDREYTLAWEMSKDCEGRDQRCR